MVEGIGAPSLRYDAVCKLCKTNKGACVSCLQCHTTVHVGCAHSNGYIFGFDMTPVKASRRDAVPTVTLNGETGTLLAAVWCKEHAPKSGCHPMDEAVEGSSLIALQLFAREFKQADLTLTGTARKANLVDQSTRVVPQTTTTQVGRRASGVAAQTPTSAKRRQSIAGLLMKDESNEHSMIKSERNCMRCHVDASPRWWKLDETIANEHAPRLVNGSMPSKGTELNGTIKKEPLVENGKLVNGSNDPSMPDAPHTASNSAQGHLRLDTDVIVFKSTSYLCQKCNWNKQNGVVDDDEEEEEVEEARPKSPSVHPDPQQLPLRSPQVQSYAPPPPPTLSASWGVPSGPPPLPLNQPPALPAWHSSAPPGPPGPPGPPPHHLHSSNGYPAPPPLQPPPLSHIPPYHAPYPQPNGYPPYSAPPMHSQMPPVPLRAPYPPAVSGPPPPPLHHGSGPMLVNGLQSPRTMPYSPTHPHAHHSSRAPEGPFPAPVAVSQYPPMHLNSSAAGRPTTPRDTIMRDPPFTASAPIERATTGASASPSLRNLLH